MTAKLAQLSSSIRRDPLIADLDCYIVGGAVRDCLLGQPVTDKDWVVVGASPQQMRALGFIPVGADFPVFLHPKTKEEFALARTERKKGQGYHGFVFYTGKEVRLKDDLQRRDLTINAMALSAQGDLIDPFGGKKDIAQKCLRHVGPAFAEDPVRLLRLARFLAQLPDFQVAEKTISLARRLVQTGEVDALVPERVWQELQKGLMAQAPQRMFHFLACVGALARICPPLVWNELSAQYLTCAAQQNFLLSQRVALLFHQSKNIDSLSKHLRLPKECTDYAVGVQRVVSAVRHYQQAVSFHKKAQAIWAVLEQGDALRREQRFSQLLAVAACFIKVDVNFWQKALAVVRQVDAKAIALQCKEKGQTQAIAKSIQQARINAIKNAFANQLNGL